MSMDAVEKPGASVTMYTTQLCPYCSRARALLDAKGITYRDIAVDQNPELRLEMMERSGRRTVPQIWIGEQHVGGYDDMAALERAGRLDELLESVRAHHNEIG